MISHMAGLVILETVVRHILICVNRVSGLEHSFNYTPCDGCMISHTAGLVILETVVRHILICVNTEGC